MNKMSVGTCKKKRIHFRISTAICTAMHSYYYSYYTRDEKKHTG